jgi:hypothetical protein
MTDDTRDWARKYLSRGWCPIPIAHGGKNPIFKDWGQLRITTDNFHLYFPLGRPLNIGLLLGVPSGGLVDVDLDADQARTLAPEHLPATGLVSGRPGRPRSHWWYVTTDAPPATIQLDGLELRSTGLQTVVPPSKHPSGESYEWAQYGDPARVTAEELTTAFYELARAALPAEKVPTPVKKANPRTEAFPPYLLAFADLNAHLRNRVMAICRHHGRNRPSIEGQKGSPALVAVALNVVRGFCLDEAAALVFLRLWNDRYSDPPWDEDEILRRIDYVTDNGNMPWGKLLIDTEYPESLPARALELREWAIAQARQT